jgi:anthranilate synthase component 1
MRKPFDLAADLDTPVSAFLKLAPLAPRFLLESAAGPERVARHSFLGFGPMDELRLGLRGLTRGGTLLSPARNRGELLAGLRRALAEAPELRADEGRPVPFAGGLVGLCAFDLVRRFERFAARRPAAADELRLLVPRAMLAFDHHRREATLLCAGDARERAALRREVRALLAGPLPERRTGGRASAAAMSLSRAAFLEQAARARAAILEGEVYQLVLSAAFEGETDLEPVALYRALRFLNPSPYMALFDFGDLAVIGASPEALVRLERGRATLQPIAGTRPRGADEARDRTLAAELLADPKEAAEHVMLVDLARNDLGRVARPGTIQVEPFRALERYSHVMHLVSGVAGTLAPETDAFDCLAACFPAGTVVGAPKLRALELIEELEPVARGFYGGTLGTFGRDGAMDQALTIRTLFLAGGRYRYQAGAGLVEASDPEAEHDEVLAKGAVLGEALALAAEGLS